MNEIASSQTALFVLVLVCFIGSKYLYGKLSFPLLHPIIISIAAISCYLYFFDIDYNIFMDKVQIFDYLLGMSVVALGYLLYEHVTIIKANAYPILIAVTVGSITGVVSVAWIAHAMGATPEIIASLQPKSVTTPIAIFLSTSSGGIASLTSIVVIIVGIFGGVAAPTILRLFGITNPIASGLSMGASAHGLGTAKAMEIGAIEGAVSGLALALMGLITALVVPLIEKILLLSGGNG